MRKDSRTVICRFLGLDQKPNGKRDRVADYMMLNFSESGHPYSVDPVLWNDEI